MPARKNLQKCVFVLMTNGFDEMETITILCTLRHAGLCVKSVGLTSGLLGGIHGVCLMPDLTISDLYSSKLPPGCLVILPEDRQSVMKLEVDPRIRQIFAQVLEEGGQIAAGLEGSRLVKGEMLQDYLPVESNNGSLPLLLLREGGQPADEFAHDLLRRLEQPFRS